MKKKVNNEIWGMIKSEEFSFQLIEQYFRKNNNSESSQIVSDGIIKDIDFHELFMFLDRTSSKIGQQYLFNRLLTIDTGNDFRRQEELIDHYTENKGIRVDTQRLLSKLNKYEAYYLPSLFQDIYIKRPKWFWIVPTFSILTILSLISIFISSKFLLLLFLLIVSNFMFHYWNKKNIYYYTDSISQLLTLMKVSHELLKRHKDNSASNSLRELNSHKKSMAMFSIESKMDSDFAAIFWSLLEYIKIIFLIEPIVVFRVLKKLDSKREDIHELFKYVGFIDTAISVASLRTGLDYFCKPKEAETPKVLNFQEIYHPLIENCTANSLDISNKSILLTGSNMSGKTTFIRTIALNVLCAQTINTCFAKEFSLKPMQVYSAIRISDDLMSDKSYYFEEVSTIKKMIDHSKDDSYKLFLLDEIFKGTNTIERIAAGKAVLSYLGRDKNIVFVSTHDLELADLLKETYELYHFTETVEGDSIFFDYKLKEGNLATRNAIRILELNDYPTEIINEAKELSTYGSIP